MLKFKLGKERVGLSTLSTVAGYCQEDAALCVTTNSEERVTLDGFSAGTLRIRGGYAGELEIKNGSGFSLEGVDDLRPLVGPDFSLVFRV